MDGGIDRAVADTLNSAPPPVVQQIDEIRSARYAAMVIDGMNVFMRGFHGQTESLGRIAVLLLGSSLSAEIRVAIYSDTGEVHITNRSMHAQLFDFGLDGKVDSLVVFPYPDGDYKMVNIDLGRLKPETFHELNAAVSGARRAADRYFSDRNRYHDRRQLGRPYMLGKGHRM